MEIGIKPVPGLNLNLTVLLYPSGTNLRHCFHKHHIHLLEIQYRTNESVLKMENLRHIRVKADHNFIFTLIRMIPSDTDDR